VEKKWREAEAGERGRWRGRSGSVEKRRKCKEIMQEWQQAEEKYVEIERECLGNKRNKEREVKKK